MCFVNINILIIKYLYYLGVGKCFAKGTKVLMYNDTHQNAENLIVGNQIMGMTALRELFNLLPKVKA